MVILRLKSDICQGVYLGKYYWLMVIGLLILFQLFFGYICGGFDDTHIRPQSRSSGNKPAFIFFIHQL
jgi:hypothetical protein